MALEYNIAGWENGRQGEQQFGGTPVGSPFSVQASTPRSGTYRYQIATQNAVSNLAFFPAGNVTGTSGTVTSGNHKRVRVRAYLRIDAKTAPFGNSQIRIFGLGGEFDTNSFNVWMDQNRKLTLKFGPGLPTIGGAGYDIGVATVNTPLQCIGATTTVSAGTAASHGFQTGASITIAGAANAVYNGTYVITVTGTNTFTYVIASNQPSTLGSITATYVSGPTLGFISAILGTPNWYAFILDVDYAVSANTAYTCSLQVIGDSDGYNQTLNISGVMGATDDMRKVTFMSERIRGGFDYSATISYDDVTYYAASDADAVNPLVLPTATKILGVPISTAAVGQGITVNAGPDQTIYSLLSTLAGFITTYDLNTYGLSGAITNASEIPIDLSGGGLGAYLESIINGGYIMFTHATAASLGISSVAVAKVYANGAISGAGTGLVETLLGYNEISPATKQVTWGAAYGDNSGAVNPAGVVSVSGWTAAQFDALKFGIRKLNSTQITRLGNILGEVLYL